MGRTGTGRLGTTHYCRGTVVVNSVHKSCTLGFRGTTVSCQFNIRRCVYTGRTSTTGTFLYDILLNPGFQDNCHYHAISKTTDDQKFGEKLSLPKGRLPGVHKT